MQQPVIPHEALAQHSAILGKTGSGKTYVAKGLVEYLLAGGSTVGIVDPTAAWWGMRSDRDGRGAGFPILVLGGDHGDLPLPALGGAAVARLLAQERVSLIADTSHLTVGERTRWFTDFGGTLYRLNRSPTHLVLDEAHLFAPQGKVPDPDTGKMLHAANTLAAGGRSRGLRLMMITQRPQKLHKDTLTCADSLIAMRVLAPQDREAVKAWILGCGDAEQGKEVLDTLAKLQRGEGWAWYPEGGFLKRLKFPRIRTFDSSATPADGEDVAAPKTMAEIDLTEVKEALAEAVRQAEATDPKLLRAKIAQLEHELADARRTPVVDPQALASAEVTGRMAGRDDVLDAIYPSRALLTEARDALDRAAEALNVALPPLERVTPAPRPQIVVEASLARVPHRPELKVPGPHADQAFPKAQRLILTALAQHPEGCRKAKVAILTGYAVNGGAFNNALSTLRTQNLITRGEPIQITEAGTRELGPFNPLPKGRMLLEHWLGQLGRAERMILTALADAHPRALTKTHVATVAGYEAKGGAFNNALSRLRTLELIKGRGELKASDDLVG